MSRLPGPDEGWRTSTEGDLDPDLTEEAGSRGDDWEQPFAGGAGMRVVRLVAAFTLVVIVVAVLAQLLR